MATRFLVRRLATLNVSRTNGGNVSGYVHRQATFRMNHFSTTFKQTQIVGTENIRDRHYGSISTNNNGKSTSDYVTDKAKEGVKKATEAAVNARDNMNDTMEGAWKAAKETGQNMSDAVTGDNDDEDRIQEDTVAVELKDVAQPVDTTEYRGVEELHQQHGGENKST